MNDLYLTQKTTEQRKELEAKRPNHIDSLATSCNHLEKPLVDFPEFIEHEELGLMILDRIDTNNSKKCPNKHNSDIAVYKVFNGARGYDDIVTLNARR